MNKSEKTQSEDTTIQKKEWEYPKLEKFSLGGTGQIAAVIIIGGSGTDKHGAASDGSTSTA